MTRKAVHEVREVQMAVDHLSTSAVSSSQAAASTVDADDNVDDDDKDGATEGNDMENKDDEDGKRVHVVLTGTGGKSGGSVEEGEEEEEEEGEESGEAHTAGLGSLAAPKPSGRITVPCPQLQAGKEKEWEK
jgi:hypothetical protein